jgi:hypothetical protein
MFVTLKVFKLIGPSNEGRRHGRGTYLFLSIPVTESSARTFRYELSLKHSIFVLFIHLFSGVVHGAYVQQHLTSFSYTCFCSYKCYPFTHHVACSYTALSKSRHSLSLTSDMFFTPTLFRHMLKRFFVFLPKLIPAMLKVTCVTTTASLLLHHVAAGLRAIQFLFYINASVKTDSYVVTKCKSIPVATL